VNRRDFLASAVGVLVSDLSFAQAENPYRRLLILVELKGGNDGLNTVVPYADGAYYGLRPRLALRRDEVLQLDERAGLHPALKPLWPLWQAGELAVVQGVGYPQPNLSHFRSIEIWDSASRADEYLQEGWLARAFGRYPPPRSFVADAVSVGGAALGPFSGGRTRSIALDDPARFLRQSKLAGTVSESAEPRPAALQHIYQVELDIGQAAQRLEGGSPRISTEFPRGPFGNAVRVASELAANRAGIAAIRVSLGGFDTHQGQPGQHARLLGELAAGIAALKDGLAQAGRWDSTLVMTYSEFGRRAQENGNLGTDHGTAAPHFLAGGRVRGGLYGDAPALGALEGGNLRHAIDFRSLYAIALGKWWNLPAAELLGGRYETLEVLRS
jgi:uncharacterized protein (DUF1501 family)